MFISPNQYCYLTLQNKMSAILQNMKMKKVQENNGSLRILETGLVDYNMQEILLEEMN